MNTKLVLLRNLFEERFLISFSFLNMGHALLERYLRAIFSISVYLAIAERHIIAPSIMKNKKGAGPFQLLKKFVTTHKNSKSPLYVELEHFLYFVSEMDILQLIKGLNPKFDLDEFNREWEVKYVEDGDGCRG